MEGLLSVKSKNANGIESIKYPKKHKDALYSIARAS